ncbi:uncharacterized protein PGRI_068490 [Penicillium griseofulvum]|uniref:RNA helicase n=1 Tax=Penicillium patulum TaxID=5078 RepID=A0A135LN21_PENPA|nr:uncharacterized protein PGRI_068490 [Penicillium griseofulvum]KXG50358.1 hypothetical protein PGRI_068490 [Penicillium griseofulvum]
MPPKFTPRLRKQRHRQNPDGESADTNIAQLQPVSKDEKEARRQKLKGELREQHPQMSAKKQKRLDKYIENKLRKEENIELLKKLAGSSVDTSSLQSSRALSNKRKRHDEVSARTAETTPKDNAPADISGYDTDDSDVHLKVSDPATDPNEQKLREEAAAGSGLKRPLELGPDGFPVLKKRKRAPKKKPAPAPVKAEVAWEGFDSGEEDEDEDEDEDDMDEESGSDIEEGSEEEDISSSEGISEDEDEDEDEEDSEDSEDDDETDENKPTLKTRQSAFKSWAVQQINEAAGFKPAEEAVTEQEQVFDPSKLPASHNTIREEPLPRELQVTNGDPNRKAYSVAVDRTEEIQIARLGLPVVGEEQKIMEAIHNNSVVVIWGATGSGKTTQLPQFLFESGFGSPGSPNPGLIGVTQPRRVAAVSMANRVAQELGQHAEKVSYQIRFESTASKKTAIKFMTDGILLREIADDFALRKYSIILIDEAHERSVNTDILIGMVSRIVGLRKSLSEEDPSVKPLKVVIMSATLRISDFTENPSLFRNGAPPLVQAEGRQYPVAVHFSRRTQRDYVEDAFRKVSRGHRKLPAGGMLVFLTGQNEIRQLSKRLKQAFKPTQREDTTQAKVQLSATEAPLEAEDLELGGTEMENPGHDDYDSDMEITGLDDAEEDEGFELAEGEEAMDSSTRVHVLPLYSQLPTKEQMKVFEPAPENSRLIILATNVAETSLTIPGIKYVFDCGRAKEKQFDLFTGVQSFQVGWISKASANQRAGRAGRTGPGHCYRMYSSAVYEGEFAEYTDPEILRTPIEGVVLQMKSMGLHNVINFPFPTPPSRQGLAKAEKLLKNLGALTAEGQITPIGRRLATYPLSPRFSKMLHIGHQHGCMPYVIALVAALAVGDLFVPENQLDPNQPLPTTAKKQIADDSDSDSDRRKVYTNADRLEDDERAQRMKEYSRAQRLFSKHDDTSDALKSLSAMCAYAYASDGDAFSEKMFLRAKAFKEATQLRRQLTDIVRSNNPGLVPAYEARLPEPSPKQLKALKQIVTAGFIDHVAIRADLAPVPPENPRTPRRAIDVPYLTLFRSRDGKGQDLEERAVYVHPSSLLAKLSPKEMPKFITYSHLQQSSASLVSDQVPKIRMFPLVAPSALQLSAIAHDTPLIKYGKPIGKADAIEGVPPRRSCWVIPELVGDAGSVGWPMPAKKVVQKKDPKEGWVIEKFVA